MNLDSSHRQQVRMEAIKASALSMEPRLKDIEQLLGPSMLLLILVDDHRDEIADLKTHHVLFNLNTTHMVMVGDCIASQYGDMVRWINVTQSGVIPFLIISEEVVQLVVEFQREYLPKLTHRLDQAEDMIVKLKQKAERLKNKSGSESTIVILDQYLSLSSIMQRQLKDFRGHLDGKLEALSTELYELIRQG